MEIELQRERETCFHRTGAIGQRICHVREEPLRLPVSKMGVVTKPLMTDPLFNVEFSSDPRSETLLRSYRERIQPKKRRERMLPPIPGWNPSGMVEKTFFFYLFSLTYSSFVVLGR